MELESKLSLSGWLAVCAEKGQLSSNGFFSLKKCMICIWSLEEILKKGLTKFFTEHRLLFG